MSFTSDSMTPDAPEEHTEEPVWQEGPSGWTESSDNEEPTFDEEGEYTGKFTSYAVPTKPDPPTTVQRERQEAWGRPISPFPYPTNRKSRWSSPLTPAETQEDSQTETKESGKEPGKEPGKQPALEVADLTMTPHDAEAEQLFGLDRNAAQEGATTSPNAATVRQVLIPAAVQPMFNFDGLSSPDHSYETPIRPPKEKPVPFITFIPKKSTASGSKTPKIQFPPPQRSFIFNSPARNVADLERDEESFVDRALSQAPEDDNEDNKINELSQRVPDLQQLEASEEDAEGEDDEDVIDLGVIKISSEDPMAAAKAAAILKLVRGASSFVVKSSLITWCSTITTSSNARADGTSLRRGSRKRHNVSAPWEVQGTTLSSGPSVLQPCLNLSEKRKPSWRSRSLEASDL